MTLRAYQMRSGGALVEVSVDLGLGFYSREPCRIGELGPGKVGGPGTIY